MLYHLPPDQPTKQAAAWELIVASIILALMVAFKLLERSKSSLIDKVPSMIKGLMGENQTAHLALYVVLFVLVFSSAIMGFFYEDK